MDKLVSLDSYWTWTEEEPHKIETYFIAEPNGHCYFIEQTDEGKHYINLLLDMWVAYLNGDHEEFKGIREMSEYARPSLEVRLYTLCVPSYEVDCATRDKYGRGAKFDGLFVYNYERRFPVEPKGDFNTDHLRRFFPLSGSLQ